MAFNKKKDLSKVLPFIFSKKLNLLESSLRKPYCIHNQGTIGEKKEGREERNEGGKDGEKERD